MAAVRVAFPQTPEDFENDPRVSYSKLDDRWILEEDDGSEWEWDANGNRWIPSVCHVCSTSLDLGYLCETRRACTH